MSSRDKGNKKSKRRRRDSDDDVVRGSGVDYSKVADRHVDDERFEKHKQGVAAVGASSASAVVDNQPKVSSQMAAVMRLMAGMEERTIAQKLADSNRPTWEQYKKDNEDKLDLVGADMKKMETYRKELDEQREKLLTRGTNHKSNDDGGKEGDKKSKKKKNSRKKHSRRHDDSYSSESDSSDDYDSNDDSRRDRKRKKHRKSSKSSKHDHKKSSRRTDSSDSYDSDKDDRKKSSKHKREKKKKKKKSGDGDSDSVGDDKYRLSSFFANGSDDESR